MTGGVWQRAWDIAKAGLTGLLLPEAGVCPFCRGAHPLPGGRLEARHFPCLEEFLFPLDGVCRCCGRPGPGDDGLCSDCWRKAPPFAGGCAVGVYAGLLRQAIHRLKFGGETALAVPLGALMAERVRKTTFPPDIIVPVPLHPRRLRQRGFNQAELLAREIGKLLDVPVRGDVLARVASGLPQARLGADRRAANVHGVFRLDAFWHACGRRVLLVDDVFTTGSTAGACADLLLEAGALRVDLAVAALSMAG